MTFPGAGAPMPYIYVPLPASIKELRLNDLWLGRWADADELPAGAPATHLYALLYMGDKGYVIREKGTDRWRGLEGELGGDAPEAWLKREVPARTGLTPGKVVLIGYLECRPTKFNTDFPADGYAVRPLYVVSAKKVADVPDASVYERRRLPMNEHIAAMRNAYPEIREHIDQAVDRYIRLQATGQA